MIVEQALGHVEDALPRQADPLECDQEVALGGFVRPGLLGRDDPVELDAQTLVRRREQVVVAVGDDAEPETRLESGQGDG